MKKVTVQISDEFYALASERAAEDGFFGVADYVNGIVNRALLEEMDEAKGQAETAASEPREPDMFDEMEEDPGGGVRLKGEWQGDEDLPF